MNWMGSSEFTKQFLMTVSTTCVHVVDVKQLLGILLQGKLVETQDKNNLLLTKKARPQHRHLTNTTLAVHNTDLSHLVDQEGACEGRTKRAIRDQGACSALFLPLGVVVSGNQDAHPAS